MKRLSEQSRPGRLASIYLCFKGVCLLLAGLEVLQLPHSPALDHRLILVATSGLSAHVHSLLSSRHRPFGPLSGCPRGSFRSHMLHVVPPGPLEVGGPGAEGQGPVVKCFSQQQLSYWAASTRDPWVLSTLTHGYKLQFRRRPPACGRVKMTIIRPGKNPSPHPVVRPPGQGCHRASRSPVATRGVLLNLFSGSKERRRTPSYPRLEGPKQVPEDPEVPHAEHRRGSAYCCQGGVVYISRPEGCLLSRSHSTAPQTVSAVCFSRPSFSVQDAPIRPLPFPTDVHQVCGGSPLTSAVAEHDDPAISGRLAPLCAIPDSGNDWSFLPCGPPGSPDESHEELPGSIAEHSLSRGVS